MAATYTVSSGVLTIEGSNLPRELEHWDFTKIQIVGAGGAASAYTLQKRSDGTAANSTKGNSVSSMEFTITFKGLHKTAIETVLNQNRTTASDGTPYNLKANPGVWKNFPQARDEASNAITRS